MECLVLLILPGITNTTANTTLNAKINELKTKYLVLLN